MGHSRRRLPPIALTMGEPAGAGPLTAALAWKTRKINHLSPFIYVGDPRAFLMHGPRMPWRAVESAPAAAKTFPTALPVWPVAAKGRFQTGNPDAKNAGAVIQAIAEAFRLCRTGQARALVTGPIHKETLLKAGFRHAGHTEFLGKLAGAKPVMMLANGELRAVPVTVHVPLKKAPKRLSQGLIVSTVEIAVRDLRRRFGLRRPRLAMTGLNPHAGEGGRLGNEERNVILPALLRLARKGIPVAGPLPADSAFSPENRRRFDCFFAMTHDQALIPVKALDFRGAVNVTLGLPFVRTSPAHGTALDLLKAGGKADPTSLIRALQLADRLSRPRRS